MIMHLYLYIMYLYLYYNIYSCHYEFDRASGESGMAFLLVLLAAIFQIRQGNLDALVIDVAFLAKRRRISRRLGLIAPSLASNARLSDRCSKAKGG